MIRLLLILCIAMGLALSTAACGVKGPPQLPEGKSDDHPRNYPHA